MPPTIFGRRSDFGAELVCCRWEGDGSGYRIDFLAGYRFLKLSDNVRIYEQLVTVDPQGPLLVGTALEVTAVPEPLVIPWFRAWAAERDGEERLLCCCSGPRGPGKLLSPAQYFRGYRSRGPGPAPSPFCWRTVRQLSCLGKYTDHEFAVVPQAELRVGRRLTDHLRCLLGYSLLYWSQVVRAGNQINTTINSTQLPAPGLSPVSGGSIPLSSSSFWAQGLTATLEWEY